MSGEAEMMQRGAKRNGFEGEKAGINGRLDDKKKQKFKWRLVKYEDLPDYLKDNEFILNYYRSEWPLKEMFLSIFSWHNETLNIWTHLGGLFLFLGLTVASLMEVPEVREPSSGFFSLTPSMKNISASFLPEQALNVTRVPHWPWFMFLVGVMICLSCSAITHLLHSHSRRANFFFWSLDYTGISLMIISSFFPAIYYAFLCHTIQRVFYLSTISFLGLIAVLTLVAPAFSSPRFRPLRGGVFLALGLSGMFPLAHALIVNEHPHASIALLYEVSMGLAYVTGAVVYMCRVPERWKPGAFDIAGHSHQIFHVFVIVGALMHYAAVRVLMDWRKGGGATCGAVWMQ